MKQYIQPFINVCKSVFKDFIGQEIEANMPHFLEKDQATEWDISGIIGLSGEARGAVVISLKDDLALKLTGILTGKVHKVLYDDVVDAVGEIIWNRKLACRIVNCCTRFHRNSYCKGSAPSQGSRNFQIPMNFLDAVPYQVQAHATSGMQVGGFVG